MKFISKKGWYWKAGLIYGWIEHGFNPTGIGIQRKYFNEPELEVVVGGISYIVNSIEAIEFVRRFNSRESHDGIKIGIISKSLFREKPVRIKKPPKIPKVKEKQPKLLKI